MIHHSHHLLGGHTLQHGLHLFGILLHVGFLEGLIEGVAQHIVINVGNGGCGILGGHALHLQSKDGKRAKSAKLHHLCLKCLGDLILGGGSNQLHKECELGCFVHLCHCTKHGFFLFGRCQLYKAVCLKGLACQNIGFGRSHLRLNQLRGSGLFNCIFCQFGGVSNRTAQNRGGGVLARANNTRDFEVDTELVVVIKEGKTCIGVTNVLIGAIQLLLIAFGLQEETEGHAAKLFIAPALCLRGIYDFTLGGGHQSFHNFLFGAQTESVKSEVADFVLLVNNQNNFIVCSGPMTVDNIVLVFDDGVNGIVGIHTGEHFLPYVKGACHRGAHTAKAAHHRACGTAAHTTAVNGVDQFHNVGFENAAGSVFYKHAPIKIILVLNCREVFFKFLG